MPGVVGFNGVDRLNRLNLKCTLEWYLMKTFVDAWLNFQYKMYALMCACPTSSDNVYGSICRHFQASPSSKKSVKWF